jgi:hypothetical protein
MSPIIYHLCRPGQRVNQPSGEGGQLQKSSNKLVLVLILLVGISVACLTGVVFGSRFGMQYLVGNDPGSAKKLAQSILDYTLPAGYLEQSSVNLGLLKTAYLTPGGEDPEFHLRQVILLVAIPPESDLKNDNIRLELQTKLLNASEEASTMEYKRTDQTSVRGEAVSLEVYESWGQYDPPTRMVYTSVFPGKSANVMIVFAGPIESWDQKVVEQFISGIR